MCNFISLKWCLWWHYLIDIFVVQLFVCIIFLCKVHVRWLHYSRQFEHSFIICRYCTNAWETSGTHQWYIYKVLKIFTESVLFCSPSRHDSGHFRSILLPISLMLVLEYIPPMISPVTSTYACMIGKDSANISWHFIGSVTCRLLITSLTLKEIGKWSPSINTLLGDQ